MAEWPYGNGEMAERIRAHDWATTSLGRIEGWPDRLKAIVDMVLASPLVSTVALTADRLLIYNDAASYLYGDRHPVALGRPLPETFPDAFQVVAPLYDRVFAGESVEIHAQPLAVSADDSSEVFDAYLTPVRAADGTIIGAHMIGLEIGNRHRAERALRESEERQTFLLKLSDALHPLADPIAIQETASRLLAERLDVDRAYYVEIDEPADIARVERDFVRSGMPSIAGEHRVSDFAWSVAILRRGDCHVVADTRTSELVPPADRPASLALGIVACMGAPLIKADRLVGALCVTASSPREWTEGEVGLLREVGERLWAAVWRGRAETALSESEARLAAAFESVPVGAAVIDMSGVAVLSNKDYRRFLPTGVVPSRDPVRGDRWCAWEAEGVPLLPQDFPAARAMRGEVVVPDQRRNRSGPRRSGTGNGTRHGDRRHRRRQAQLRGAACQRGAVPPVRRSVAGRAVDTGRRYVPVGISHARLRDDLRAGPRSCPARRQHGRLAETRASRRPGTCLRKPRPCS